jgi:hypothetical protein
MCRFDTRSPYGSLPFALARWRSEQRALASEVLAFGLPVRGATCACLRASHSQRATLSPWRRERLQRLFQNVGAPGGAGGGGPPGDSPQADTAEQVYISSLALLKMLKHGAPRTQPARTRRVRIARAKRALRGAP